MGSIICVIIFDEILSKNNFNHKYYSMIKERSQNKQKPYDYIIKQIILSIYLDKYSLISSNKME